MFELIIGIACVVAMVKIAGADGQSGMLWGLITFALCFACVVLIPLPFLRIGIAFILAFAAMIGYKVVANK